MDFKKIKLVNPKGNQPRILIGRTNTELKLQYFSHLMQRADSPDAGKDRSQEEKETTEDEMVVWHHQLSGHKFKQVWKIVKDREA